MRDRNGPTLGDVARHAGVSAATVSRCLNGPSAVRPNKRARVDAAIDALGYVPHAAAQALASRRSRMVGAVFPRLNSILFGSFFGALQRRLDEVGFALVVSTSDYDLAQELRRIRELLSRSVDALVLVGHDHHPETYRLLTASAVPHLVTWAWRDGAPTPQIGFSNAAGMGSVVDYLVGVGHRRVALVSGSIDGNDRARERLDGARARLRHAGLDLPPDMVEQVPFEIEEGAAAFARLVARRPRPTAIICGSDLFAFGALREARQLGLAVPEDVTVTGFDDTDFAACSMPSLTTLRTPRQLMARRTADMLIDLLRHGRALRSLRLDTELVVRESSGPPPGHAPSRRGGVSSADAEGKALAGP